MGQGQGSSTLRKEDGFSGLLRMTLLVSKAKATKAYPYYHIDLNAGGGYNDLASCDGSPLIFLHEALRAGRPFRAFLCESDAGLCAALRARLPQAPAGSWLEVLETDNAAALPLVAADIHGVERSPRQAVGTCLCDPNGFREGFPVEALVAFLGEFPRIDLILNVNARVLRMGLGAKRRYIAEQEKCPPPFKGFVNWPLLSDLLRDFGRKHWMVRNPPSINTDHFVMVYGHNRPRNFKPFLGFYPLESPQGKDIVENLAPLRKGQLFLFE